MALSHVQVNVRTFRLGQRLALALAARGWFRLASLVPLGHVTIGRHRSFMFLPSEVIRLAWTMGLGS